jgi:hypothetical protein
MAEPKSKPEKRVAGKSKFRLPERTRRPVEANPLRELLREAKDQEQALTLQEASPLTPAKQIAGVSKAPQSRPIKEKPAETPVMPIAGVSAPVSRATSSVASSALFDDFSRRWAPILRSGQMSVCRVLFELTHGAGATECFTSMPKLAAAAGIKERQCYNVVGQLEMLGFIERPHIYNTPTQKGTVFRLNLEPRPQSARSERRYHIGGESEDDTPAM